MIELELEFRTSEMNGVFLSVSEPQGYPALSLELQNGKVFTDVYSFISNSIYGSITPYIMM